MSDKLTAVEQLNTRLGVYNANNPSAYHAVQGFVASHANINQFERTVGKNQLTEYVEHVTIAGNPNFIYERTSTGIEVFLVNMSDSFMVFEDWYQDPWLSALAELPQDIQLAHYLSLKKPKKLNQFENSTLVTSDGRLRIESEQVLRTVHYLTHGEVEKTLITKITEPPKGFQYGELYEVEGGRLKYLLSDNGIVTSVFYPNLRAQLKHLFLHRGYMNTDHLEIVQSCCVGFGITGYRNMNGNFESARKSGGLNGFMLVYPPSGLYVTSVSYRTEPNVQLARIKLYPIDPDADLSGRPQYNILQTP